MNRKYENLAKEITFQGRMGNVKLGAVLDKSFLDLDGVSLRYALVDGCGMIPEETEKLHTHDYDQMLWFLSADPEDMLNLGAELEVDLGAEGIRHRIAIPHTVVIPKGTPHFSPIVTSVNRPFIFLAINCSGEMKADIADENAVPQTGAWSKFFGEFSKNVKHLSFAANDPYHYGSERSQPSGGISTHVDSTSTGIPLTITWSTVKLPHNLGPWGADGKHRSHVHQDFDELFLFLSLDQDSQPELHGTADFCVGEDGEDQEHYLLTKASAMTMKKGIWHLPLTFLEVRKPMLFINISNH
ncbi:MAG: hypothetical protein GX942_09495 [Papillibacter sp.]|nr:hypothetical protein [Papillibacter sp.]